MLLQRARFHFTRSFCFSDFCVWSLIFPSRKWSISKTASDRNLTKESISEGEMKVLGKRAFSLTFQQLCQSIRTKEKGRKTSAHILVISRVGSEPCHNWLNNSEHQHNNTNDSMSTRHLTVEKRRERLMKRRT